ncbi:MAG: hypothetical protein V3T53_01675 [Phycisphaerales bacterium]
MAAAVLLLLIASIPAQRLRVVGTESALGGAVVRLFTLDEKGTIPNWFAAALLFCCSALLAVIASAKHRAGVSFRYHWWALSAIVLLLSVDHATAFHLDEFEGAGGGFHIARLAGAAVVFVGVGLVYRRFVAHLPSITRCTLVVAAALYVGAAFGRMWMSGWQLHGAANPEAVRATVMSVTAALQLTGILAFFCALMHYLDGSSDSIQIGHTLPRTVGRFLVLLVACLLVLGLAGQLSKFLLGHGRLFGFVGLFDLDGEANIPAWFSAMGLLTASLLLVMIASATTTTAGRYVWHWWGLALVFAYVSLDEAASIHELSIEPLRLAFDLDGWLRYAWVVPASVLVMIGLAVYLPFLVRLPRKICCSMLIAAALYLGGAMGIELVGGRYASLYGIETLAYQFIVLTEEILEMLGIAVFVCTLLVYIEQQFGVLSVRFGDPAPQSVATSNLQLDLLMHRAAAEQVEDQTDAGPPSSSTAA